MSSGRLVVLDRAGRAGKAYPLRAGEARLGSDAACDIRVMLPAVSPHHATVVVNTMQTVVHSVSERATLVNGARVTLAALRHGDVISLGGRALRWEYDDPHAERPLAPEPALQRRVQRKRAVRRGSEPPRRDVFVDAHRASMPAAVSGRQVAIVQPQRRDTSDLSDAAPSLPPTARPSAELAEASERASRRAAGSPTKASLWIESRKCSPRKAVDTPVEAPSAKTPPPAKTRGRTPGSAPAKVKSPEKGGKTPARPVSKTPAGRRAASMGGAPLRLLVLKKAQNKVTKIQAPLKMDSTKQAAIMLMTRHTPKQRGGKRPSYVVKKPSPVSKTPKQPQRASARHTPKASPKESLKPTKASPKATQARSSPQTQNQSAVSRTDDSRYVTDSLIEITDSESSSETRGNTSRRSQPPASPRKSALRDPRHPTTRKNESIKFDLSNLQAPDRPSDIRPSCTLGDSQTNDDSTTDLSATELTLRYSDTSDNDNRTPSPRASLASRRDRMLEKTLGTSVEFSKSDRESVRTASPRSTQSLRGISMIRRALENSEAPDVSSYSRRTTRSLNPSRSSAVSARTARSLSPRVRNHLESYSIIDLVSTMDSDGSSDSRPGSVYDSAASIGSAAYDTPVLGSSTPYHSKGALKARGSGRVSKTRSNKSNATSDEVTTPENSEDATKTITFNSTRISRASKSRSRINESDAMITEEEDDASPKSSKRLTKVGRSSPLVRKNMSLNITATMESPSTAEGMHTPENRHSPEEATTPMLSIQSLLDASQNSTDSPNSIRRVSKRKSLRPQFSRRIGSKSKSMSMVSERSLRGRDNFSASRRSRDNSQNDEEVVTPKSAVKLVPEGVKNKHSTAKKPQSKRSIIDDLDRSDIVKQLFNSPVKRNLSQSMTEFSRKQLFEDEDNEAPARLTRSPLAVAGNTPDDSILDNTDTFTPEVFVSPLNTPSNSPNMTGIKRLFQKTTPNNDLRNVRGVKGLLRTPHTRKSIKNDLTKVSGVKRAFARSPCNRLSDVRGVRELFAASPNSDLRRVSGVKGLFQSQKKTPTNELTDVRGVKNLFRETRNSPRNDLTDVRGVKQIFREKKDRNNLSDMSGVEQLFHETSNFDSTFDQLMGRAPIRATYIKAKSFTVNRVDKKKNKKTGSKSLHDSIGLITTNVEEWLEKELRNRIQKDVTEASTSKGRKSSPNKSKNASKMVVPRELQKLSTDTVSGSNSTVIVNRTRSILKNEQSTLSSQKRSASELYGAHMLPIKKRSLVEASLNTTDKFSKSNKLPIKKRAVVHSTPVKGRVNITMNVSEIGRMSPISSADKTSEVETAFRPPQQPQVSPKPKTSISKTKQPEETTKQLEKSVEKVQQSPKRTRRFKASLNTTTARGPRGRKSIKEIQETNIKKRRSSIVIVKKPPVLSPKPPSPKTTRRGKANREPEKQELAKASPKKTRLTRGQKSQTADVKPATPKRNTRAKIKRSSIVVVKPSPKLKPRATRRTKEQPEVSEVETRLPTRGKRKTTTSESKSQSAVKKPESPKESQALEPVRKTRKTNVADSKAKGRNADIDIEILVVQMPRRRKVGIEPAQSTDNAQTKRTRKVSEKVVEEPKTRSRKNIEPQLSVESDPPTRRKAANAKVSKSKTVIDDFGAKPTNRRTRAAVENNENIKKDEKETTRGRKRKNTDRDDTVPTETKTTKQTRSTKSVSEKPVTKPGKAKNGQSTKSKPDTEVVKTASRRGVKEVSKSEKEIKTTRKGAGTKTASQENTPKEVETGKSTRAAEKPVEPKPVRGKKVAVAQQEAPKESGRKKRTNVDISDAKESKKQPAKKARTAAASPSSPAPKLTRTRAAKLTARAGGDGRSRGR